MLLRQRSPFRRTTSRGIAGLAMSLAPLAAQSPADVGPFAWKLFAAVADAKGNPCVSPWSIAVAVGMARAGAAGDTAREIDAALGCKDDAALGALARCAKPQKVREWTENGAKEVDAYTLLGANAAFLAERTALLPDYGRALEQAFEAAPRRVDFKSPRARDTINAWVAEQTQTRIRDLLPAGLPDPDTRLVLVNCLYLKAPWVKTFAEHATQDRPFQLASGEKVDVPTMQQTEQLDYAETANMQLVRLLYRGGDLAMLVAVPREGAGLEKVAADVATLADGTMKPTLVQLDLPRFRTEASFQLREVLAKLGMPRAFDPQRADFSRMTKEPVFISEVVHKTFVQIDENGTEAAAATAVMVGITSAAVPVEPPKPVIVRADRPFLFAIVHARAGVLFVGRVNDPR